MNAAECIVLAVFAAAFFAAAKFCLRNGVCGGNGGCSSCNGACGSCKGGCKAARMAERLKGEAGATGGSGRPGGGIKPARR